ncbi:MAG TPA: cytochrome c biogenesis protein [Ramlibacter sp.]|uniref:cytochrome c biogenesis protein n=1 Tax=Ramlibacter sp. TaxID=1917967 RepID=UPI002D7F4ECC|nr:cytochrome c biogenesis protein [Ramlibacter sp.]HET8745407.1 cytochrome c biogenesis protein [Ramlibacter sp.]
MTVLPSVSAACPNRALRGLVRALGLAAILLAALAATIGWRSMEPLADYTIVYVHVPAAWLSLLLYGVAVAAAADHLLGPARLPVGTLPALAPVGAAASIVALCTGLASQQAQGSWWALDARLVTELVLLLLFAGLMALRRGLEEPERAQRAGAVLVLTGALNIPIVYLSVDWWHGLHERAAASVAGSSLVTGVMALMTLASCFYAGAVVLARLEAFTRERDREPGGRDFGSARAEGGSARKPAKE